LPSTHHASGDGGALDDAVDGSINVADQLELGARLGTQ
jgi:hypothetical protein